MLTAGIDHLGRPVRGLHFTDVCLSQKEHAKTGLTDTAADCEREFIIQKHLVEGQFSAMITVCNFKLF